MKTDIAMDWNYFADTVLQVIWLLDKVEKVKPLYSHTKHSWDSGLGHNYYDYLESLQKDKMNCVYSDTRKGKDEKAYLDKETSRIRQEERSKMQKVFSDKYGGDGMVVVNKAIVQAYANGYEDGIRDKPNKINVAAD